MENQTKKLSEDQIKVGGVYISKTYSTWAREVVRVYGADEVQWRGYDLTTGAPSHNGSCSKYALAKWALREATPEESAMINRDDAITKEALRGYEQASKILGHVPDEMLLEEVRKRGLKVA